MEQRDNKYFIRFIILIAADILSIFASYFIALWARFEFVFENVPDVYTASLVRFILAALAVYIVVYLAMHLYHSIWRYASVSEAYRIAVAYIIIGVVLLLLNLIPALNIPRSCLFFGYVLSAFCCLAIRFGYRLLRNLMISSATAGQDRDRVLLIGAGFAGCEILKNAHFNRNNRVCAVVDDNPTTWGKYLEGVRIAGGRDKIPELVDKHHINTIVFAIPSASKATKQEIIGICKETGCRLKTVPALERFTEGEERTPKLRDIDLEDFLGMDADFTNHEDLYQAFHEKTILITGAGGSIGTELLRQIATTGPKKLILFDINENDTYLCAQRLTRKYPELETLCAIGSVADERRVKEVMGQYFPDIVFHCAAYKQIPLMEANREEVRRNNEGGTRIVAQAAAEAGAEKFIYLSAHKAAKPDNLMYQTKREGELAMQEVAESAPKTMFVTIRFGNVIGTSGSVTRLFREQIQEGGPITVTHPEIIRRFTSLTETVSLILQAAAMADHNTTYLLAAGDALKVDDLARNMIQLAGLKPEIDIPIVYTGLREGESLDEDLGDIMQGFTPTTNERICENRELWEKR